MSAHANACFARWSCFDKLWFYYAFGNTVPTNLFLAEGRKDAYQVLLLASGDLRSALYSLERDSRRRVPVHFTLNDACPHVVARNIVLLWLLRHHDSAEDIYAVWFSLGLSARAKAALDAALAALSGNCEAQLAGIGVDLYSTEDRAAVGRVLREWASWELSWSRVQELRQAYLCKHFKVTTFEEVVSRINRSARWELMLHDLQCDSSSVANLENSLRTRSAKHCLPTEAAAAEFEAYIREGVVEFNSEPATCLNVTLFTSPDTYMLHYGSVPYKAFPLFEASYDQRKPLLTSSLAQLRGWITELHARASTVRWTFAAGDCLHLCGKLVPTRFDVVSTSNVADHVGLLPLLQAARMVTCESGYLITETLLHLSYAQDTSEYLKVNLMMEPELWPGVLGWRCFGYEGKLAPRSSEVQFELPNLTPVFSKASREKEKGERTRGEARFVWRPARSSNVPLQLNGSMAIAHLINSCRLEEVKTPFCSEGVVPCATGLGELRDGMHRLHLPTLLPILCSGAAPAEQLSAGDVEMADLLSYWAGQKPLHIATVSLSDAALQATIEPQPNLCILLHMSTGSTLLYSALWLESTGKDEQLVCFLVDPEKLKGASASLVGSHQLGCTLGKYDHIPSRPSTGPAPELSGWLKCEQSAQSEAGIIARIEEPTSWQLPIALSETWWALIDSGGSVQAKVLADGHTLAVSITSAPSSKVELVLPSRARAADIRVQLSRKRKHLNLIVQKEAYEFGAIGGELWLDDCVAWPSVRLPDKYMVTVSGLMFSQQEKFISRSRHHSEVTDPLIPLKDTIMYFFQLQDEVIFHLAVSADGKGQSVNALIVHHGLRREHRLGTPAADLSISFLTLDILEDLIPWWQKTYPPDKAWKVAPNGKDVVGTQGGIRNVMCTQEEYDLLQSFVRALRTRAKDDADWKTPPARAPLPKHVRKYFVRVLVPPLFAHQKAHVEMLSKWNLSEKLTPGLRSGAASKEDTLEQTMAEAKAAGSRLVAEGQHHLAIDHYQHAIVAFTKERKANGEKPAAKRLAAQCYLNLALCLLAARDTTKAPEAIICCDAALELLEANESALQAKALYRKGQALELQSKLEAAGDDRFEQSASRIA